MIVLGIDPGTAALGYGIVEATRGRVREVDHGGGRADELGVGGHVGAVGVEQVGGEVGEDELLREVLGADLALEPLELVGRVVRTGFAR